MSSTTTGALVAVRAFKQCPVHSIEMIPEDSMTRATIDGNEAGGVGRYRLTMSVHLPDHAVVSDGPARGQCVQPGPPRPVAACRPSSRSRREQQQQPFAQRPASRALATTFTASPACFSSSRTCQDRRAARPLPCCT